MRGTFSRRESNATAALRPRAPAPYGPRWRRARRRRRPPSRIWCRSSRNASSTPTACRRYALCLLSCAPSVARPRPLFFAFSLDASSRVPRLYSPESPFTSSTQPYMCPLPLVSLPVPPALGAQERRSDYSAELHRYSMRVLSSRFEPAVVRHHRPPPPSIRARIDTQRPQPARRRRLLCEERAAARLPLSFLSLTVVARHDGRWRTRCTSATS